MTAKYGVWIRTIVMTPLCYMPVVCHMIRSVLDSGIAIESIYLRVTTEEEKEKEDVSRALRRYIPTREQSRIVLTPTLPDLERWLVLEGDRPLFRSTSIKALVEHYERNSSPGSLLIAGAFLEEEIGDYQPIAREQDGVRFLTEREKKKKKRHLLYEIYGGAYVHSQTVLDPTLLASHGEIFRLARSEEARTGHTADEMCFLEYTLTQYRTQQVERQLYTLLQKRT